MTKRYFVFPVIAVLLLLAVSSSCKKDKISTDSAHQLSFSTDTLAFDTVFSTVGSSTRIFKIYNPNAKRVNISSINLGGGSSSFFRLNINGKSGISFANVELPANDSLWVFAEVTVDPGANGNPFLVLDSLVCQTNGNVQKVILSAYGQNAIFHKANSNEEALKLSCSEVWDNTIAHVVFGKVRVDTNCSLTIKKGTQVYFYNDGKLLVSKGASVRITGTFDEPVVFEGSRLESWYENTPGQWEGVVLEEESQDHEISFLQLKNARNGIVSLATSKSNTTALLMNNCVVKNCSKIGINLQESSAEMNNVVVCNSGSKGLVVEGGNYVFSHCTFFNSSSASSMEISNESVLLKNWRIIDDEINVTELNQADFYNCILYGVEETALLLSQESGLFNYLFTNCLIKTNAAVPTGSSSFVECLINQDPKFEDVNLHDLSLTENSPAIDAGNVAAVNSNLVQLQYDLNNYSRLIDNQPDIGAYEYKK